MDELLIEDLDCERPCSNIIIKADKIREDKNFYTGKESINKVVYLKFYQRVKVMRNQYAFPLLSLIAEIGGYVGLFMGVGILQTSNLLKMLALKYLWNYLEIFVHFLVDAFQLKKRLFMLIHI